MKRARACWGRRLRESPRAAAMAAATYVTGVPCSGARDRGSGVRRCRVEPRSDGLTAPLTNALQRPPSTIRERRGIGDRGRPLCARHRAAKERRVGERVQRALLDCRTALSWTVVGGEGAPEWGAAGNKRRTVLLVRGSRLGRGQEGGSGGLGQRQRPARGVGDDIGSTGVVGAHGRCRAS